jgi:hypothetical protein
MAPSDRSVHSRQCQGIVLFSLSTGEKRCLHTPPAADIGDSDLLYYNFSNRQLKPVLMLKQDTVEGTANLAATRDGRTISMPR